MTLPVLLASVALATCHGQFAPPTKAERERAQIERYMTQRAEFGFRADEAYVRKLIRRGVWEYDVGSFPVTRAENRYLRLRDRLALGRKARRYLNRRTGLSGGISIEDDWPRGPYILVRLTRNRAAHARNLSKLARFPRNLRTVQVRHSERRLRQVQRRIDRDWEALKTAGFDISTTAPDVVTNRVAVELITKRTDAQEYFTQRYGPVTVDVIATEPYSLECEQADHYELSPDGTGLVVVWYHSGSVELERVDVVEHADRVEIGIVDRVPHGLITADAQLDRHRVTLARPLGDRVVIDMADGRRLAATG